MGEKLPYRDVYTSRPFKTNSDDVLLGVFIILYICSVLGKDYYITMILFNDRNQKYWVKKHLIIWREEKDNIKIDKEHENIIEERVCAEIVNTLCQRRDEMNNIFCDLNTAIIGFNITMWNSNVLFGFFWL